MSDLPEKRTTQAALFLYTGMDVFGPFYVKEGRKTLKRYGLIFTCLASRAVHLETLNTLETDSFISAIIFIIHYIPHSFSRDENRTHSNGTVEWDMYSPTSGRRLAKKPVAAPTFD